MKPACSRTLLAASLALGLLVFWLFRGRASAPSPAPSPNRPSASVAPAPAASATRPAPVYTPSGKAGDIDRVMAEFAARLRALQQVQTGDNATVERLRRELLAYVNDDNVEDLAKSLSASELDTPFGLDILEYWTRRSPLEAVTWMGARNDPPTDHVNIAGVELAKHPEILDRFAAESPDSDWKHAVLHRAGLDLVDHDRERALALGFQLPAGQEQTDLLETTVYSWCVSDPANASAWVQNQPDSPLRERLLATLARTTALHDPQAGALQLVASVKDPEVLSNHLSTIAQNWVRRDPIAAARWAEKLPAGPARSTALGAIASRWSQTQPDAAMGWITTLPEAATVLKTLGFDPTDAAALR